MDPQLPISLTHPREETYEFLDDYDLSWDICPVSQQVTYMGHVRVTSGPEGEPSQINTSHVTMNFKLPFEWMWTPPTIDSRIDSNSELVTNPERSTQGSVAPPLRRQGAQIRYAARKSNLYHHHHSGETSTAVVAPAAAVVAPANEAVVPAPELPLPLPLPVPNTLARARKRVTDFGSRDFGGFHFDMPLGSDWDIGDEDLEDTSSDPSYPDLAAKSPSKKSPSKRSRV